MRGGWCAALAVLLNCACAERVPDQLSPDAGMMMIVERPPPDAPQLPQMETTVPMPPALPVLTPCPSGWRTVTTSTDVPVRCDPWPEGGRAICPQGQAHFPGEPSCADIGSACDPNDLFAPDLPASGVFYVDSAAAPGGDGTRTAPFTRIADA